MPQLYLTSIVVSGFENCIDLSNGIYDECDRGINTDEMEDLDRFQCKSVFCFFSIYVAHYLLYLHCVL